MLFKNPLSTSLEIEFNLTLFHFGLLLRSNIALWGHNSAHDPHPSHLSKLTSAKDDMNPITVVGIA